MWNNYTDKQFMQNPLTALLRVQNMPSWYFGVWRDRWKFDLWGWAIRLRDLPEALGSFWLIPVLGLALLCFLRGMFWVLLAIALVASYLSVYLFFPVLHINNPYYQVENVFLLCAAVAVVAEGLLQRGEATAGYAVLVATMLSQVWSLYTGVYGQLLFVDFHKHPFYQAGRAVQETTSPDSVVVVFGTGWGADLPYFAQRRGFVIANWFPVPLIHQMLFEERERWFDGRKLGAMVDCAVYDSERIAPVLQPIRDALKQELNGRTINVVGLPYTLTTSQPQCQIYLLANPSVSKVERKGGAALTNVFSKEVGEVGSALAHWKPVPCYGDGNMDNLNGHPSTPTNIETGDILEVNGWLTVSAKDGVAADAAFIAVKDAKGDVHAYATEIKPRPDVGAYFGKQSLNNSGYFARVDVGEMGNAVELGVARMKNGRVELCAPVRSVKITH